MMKKLFILIFSVGLMNLASGQEGIPVYLDYLTDNYYLLHPSMAGASTCGKVRLTARQQWFDQEDAPNLQTLSFNTAIGEKSGIGAIVFNDQNGFHSQTGAYLSYAYHLDMGSTRSELNRFSFGMNAGIVQSRLDETEFDLRRFDPIIAGVTRADLYLNFDVGASYFFNNFYAHFTVKNLVYQEREIYTRGFESDNQRRYLATAGYVFTFDRNPWSFEPSVLYQLTEETGEQFADFNAKAYYDLNEDSRLFGGLSYRQSFDGAEFVDGTGVSQQNLALLSPILGVNYKNFLFAYTYSHQFGDINFADGGYHQLTIGFDFLCSERKWNCNCPAVNTF